jgi:signal transduction histidine kinase
MWRLPLFTCLGLLLGSPVSSLAQTQKLPIGEAAIRRPDGRALREGQKVILSGVASIDSQTLHSDLFKIYVQDETAGICIYATEQTGFPVVRVGDIVEAEGTLDTYAGMVELKIKKLRVIGKSRAPAPVEVKLKDLRSHRFYGRLVTLHAPVMGVRPIAKGFIVALGTPQDFIDLHLTQRQLPSFQKDLFRPGTVISITGISSQYDHELPFREGWQILPRVPTDLRLVGSAPLFRAEHVALAVVVFVALGFLIIWWNFSLRREVARKTRVYEQMAESLRIELDQRKRAEKALETSELNYRTLVESLNDGLAQVDDQETIVFVNRRLCEMSGYDRDDLLGKKAAELIGHIEEDLFLRRDGTSFSVEWVAEPIVDQGGLRGQVISFSDVSERVVLQRQLEQANRVRSLGQLAATVAHEFNNVLMGIQPFVELIRKQSPAGASTQKATDSILKSVARGKRISLEILRYARPVEPTLRSIPVAKWLADISEELHGLIGASIKLNMRSRANTAHVLADPAQLSQVFTNLALNARDAMPKGGTLTIAVEEPGRGSTFSFAVVPNAHQFVHFAVSDNGVGIPRELLNRVFEPLFTTKKNEGTGLGLAVTHQIITNHGGLIFVQSEVGLGTTFHLFFPAAAEQRDGDVPAEKPATSGVDRLLLVEDDVLVAEGLAAMLESAGVEVRTVHRAAEAFEAVAEFQPRAVVVDIGLPDMDGVELYRRLAQRWPKLPVIFSSGHGDESKLQEYLALPHVDFLLKPYAIETLLSRLEAVSSPIAA